MTDGQIICGRTDNLIANSALHLYVARPYILRTVSKISHSFGQIFAVDVDALVRDKTENLARNAKSLSAN